MNTNLPAAGAATTFDLVESTNSNLHENHSHGHASGLNVGSRNTSTYRLGGREGAQGSSSFSGTHSLSQRESANSLPRNSLTGGSQTFVPSSASSATGLQLGMGASDQSMSFMGSGSTAAPAEPPARVSSAAGSTIGTEGMMGSAGQMLITSVVNRLVERVSTSPFGEKTLVGLTGTLTCL